jgi:hypothetical protein
MAGTMSDDEWDEFLSVPIADAELETVRRAIPLEGRQSLEGQQIIERCLAKLRA